MAGFQDLVMHRLLDGRAHALREEVAQEPDQATGGEPEPERDPATRFMAVPWLQHADARRTRTVSLLVREGSQPQAYSGTITAFVRTDVFQEAADIMSASVLPNLPRRPLSALHLDGPYSDLFLWQEHLDEALYGDGLHHRLQLPGDMW
jgi:hypothetical protein